MPHVDCGTIKTAYEIVACLNAVLHYRLLAPLWALKNFSKSLVPHR